MTRLNELCQALQRGDEEKVQSLIRQALEGGTPPERVLREGLIAGMDVVGERFKRNEISFPEVLFVAKTMNAALRILEPRLVETGVKPTARIVLGTVQGDMHDIGKNLVGMMLRGAGFEVHDLGVSVAPEKFVRAVQDRAAQLVAMSVLLGTTVPGMNKCIEALREAGLTEVKTMVGGAPLTQRLAVEIGADGYAPDAASAVEKARDLLGQ